MYLFKDIKMASANERIFYFFRKRMHLEDSKQLCPASKNDFLMIVENLPLPFFDFFSPPPTIYFIWVNYLRNHKIVQPLSHHSGGGRFGSQLVASRKSVLCNFETVRLIELESTY